MTDQINIEAVCKAANSIKKDHNHYFEKRGMIPPPFNLCKEPQCIVAEFALRILNVPKKVQEAINNCKDDGGGVYSRDVVAQWFLKTINGIKYGN